jgi:hypothetical protein
MTFARLFVAALAVSIPLSSGCDNASPGASLSGTPPSVEDKGSLDTTPVVAVPKVEAIVDSSFDDIKFEMEKTNPFERSLLTPKIEDLFGRRIRIRGFMLPTMKKRGLKEFVLVRDNLECCFGPGAALFDCIFVHMNEGQTAEFSIRPIAVEGTFSLDEFIGPDGAHLAIYRLDSESAK